MRKETIGKLSISVPDGFESMSAEQLRRYFSVTENLIGFYRAGDNTMISVGCTPKRLLTSLLFSAGDVIKSYDSSFSKRLRSYKRTGEISGEIAGTVCPGMSFEFSTQHEDVPMKAEVYSVKHKGTFYGLIFIARKTGGCDIEKLVSEIIPHIVFEA